MATAIRTIGHEDQLSVVDHLEELRTRLIVSGVALALAFGVCLWQNHALLEFINAPLAKQTRHQVARFEGPLGETWRAQKTVRRVAGDTESLARTLSAPKSGLPAATRAQLAAAAARLRSDVGAIPASPPSDAPVTLGPGEPLTTTLTVALYFAAVFALPLILFELYGFVLPAFSPSERRMVVPLLASIPFLFAAGVAFGYLVVLPAAVHFLQNFNSSQFNVMVQASQYYKFAATILLAMGVCFQAPVAIVGAVRAGLVTPRQLRHNRRYALLACAAVAAFLPGDVFTLLLETVPLYLLYEASILIAAVVSRHAPTGTGVAREGRGPRKDSPASTAGPSGGDEPPPGDGVGASRGADAEQPTKTKAEDMIDHTDPTLSD
jgi:sec-independent protein translocase protein TatC